MLESNGMAHRTLVLQPGIVDAKATVSIAPLKACTRLTLRLSPEGAAEIGTAAGFRLNEPINTCISKNGRMAARLGPDEWLLFNSDSDSESVERELARSLGDHFFSIVDISHRNAAIAVSGHHAREVINGGSALDLDDAAFPAGSATRTLFGKAAIVLIRASAERIYRLECWRSFAPYVHGFLKDVAREFEGGEPPNLMISAFDALTTGTSDAPSLHRRRRKALLRGSRQRRAGRLRARVRRRLPQLGAAGALLLAALPLHRLQRARLAALRRAAGRGALFAGARLRRHPLGARWAADRQGAHRRLSMGGLATLHFGLTYPSRARSLLVAGAGYGSEPGEREKFRAEAVVIAAKLEKEGMAAFAETYAHGATARAVREQGPARLCRVQGDAGGAFRQGRGQHPARRAARAAVGLRPGGQARPPAACRCWSSRATRIGRACCPTCSSSAPARRRRCS